MAKIDINTLIISLGTKVARQRLSGKLNLDPEIENLYSRLAAELGQNYEAYTAGVSRFLDILEENNQYAIPYGIELFMNQVKVVLKRGNYKDLDDVDGNPEPRLMDRFYKLFIEQVKPGLKVRLSDNILDFSSLKLNEQKDVVGGILTKLQVDCKDLNWNEEMVYDTLNLLLALRSLLLLIGETEILYHALWLFFDRLASSEINQMGRNIAEEIIFTSFSDKETPHGFFCAFRFYSNTSNIHAALMYANISLSIVIRENIPISRRFAEEIIWQGMKLFRNVHLGHFADKLYSSIPGELFTDRYMRRAVDLTHFHGMLGVRSLILPGQLLDYLRKEREEILGGGIHDALPWLITMYNVKRLYPDADFSPMGFGFFVSIFEMMVPEKLYKKQKDILMGNSEEIKVHLKDSLTKLLETYYSKDFVYDNQAAIKSATRMVSTSVESQDVEGFLLAMLVKSDYSILFKENRKLVGEDGKREKEVFHYPEIYQDPVALKERLMTVGGDFFSWLAVAEHAMVQMGLFDGVFTIAQIKQWSRSRLRSLEAEHYFERLSFDETKKDRNGQVYEVSQEEYHAQSAEIAKMVDFMAIGIPNGVQSMFLVKDMQLSAFPHNLLLDTSGAFVAESVPVTNIISTEWMLSRDGRKLDAGYSKGIWNPVESEDMALLYLEAYLEDTCHAFGIHKQTTIKLDKPMSADMNIICSHGGTDIAGTQLVRHKDSATYDLDTVIGPGRILILFVCHSGSQENEVFRNSLQSLIKRYLASGYEAVVAPAWALHISVPKIWLPVFMEAIENGERIDLAVFLANRAVAEKFATPAAWANLHLYGNPNLSLA